MKSVKLTGKTKKGKERIKQFGSLWTVFRIEDKLAIGPGPWLAVEPADSKFWRWVHKTDDKDFEVIDLTDKIVVDKGQF